MKTQNIFGMLIVANGNQNLLNVNGKRLKTTKMVPTPRGEGVLRLKSDREVNTKKIPKEEK